ncbi:MAG TPA: hypothetical protein VME70_06600 [Mycobacteriales bacterium]|nr:hypothetical protein [Mycobacteriales bacterium]
MPNDQGPEPTADELDALPTAELRERAFARAERHHDIGFFWDLVKHLPSSETFGSDDGSAGGLGESIGGAVELVRELLGRNDEGGALGPMLRARYIDYLTSHP